MAEEIKSGFADTKENNDAVAEKLKQQGNELLTTTPTDLKSSDEALDALVAEKKKEKEKEIVVPEPDKKDENPPAKTPAELEAEKKAQEEAAAKAAQADANKKRADDLFKDTPNLPPNASPKSSEAFNAVKIRAAQEISALEAERDKLKKENEELAAKASKPLTPEVEKEIEELRHFRSRIDLEADPKFKAFDKTVENAREFIYAQLKKSDVINDEVIAEIKKHGGPDKVKLEKIFEAVKDPTLERLVQAKIAEIETAKYDKELAIKSAKENVAKYLEEREKSVGEAATAHNAETKTVFEKLRTGSDALKWMAERKADDKADEATKKSVAEHNEFVKVTQQQLAAALEDDSPEMRAILLAGFAQLLYSQRVNAADKARLATIETDHKKVVESHLATIKELQTKLDKIKGASVSRLESSGAISSGKPAEIKAGDLDTRPTTQALDDIAREIREKRNA